MTHTPNAEQVSTSTTNRSAILYPLEDQSGSMTREMLQGCRDRLQRVFEVPIVDNRLVIEPVLMENFAELERMPAHGWYRQFAGRRGRAPRY